MKIIGKKFISYDRKSDGRHIEGYELHYTFPAKSVEGVATDKQFISMAAVEASGGVIPNVGDEIDFLYNRFGKISSYITK